MVFSVPICRINDPQSDSEDESITTSSYYDNKGLFYDDNGENSNSNSYSGDTLNYQRSKKYIEPTAEELEKQRESKKQIFSTETTSDIINGNVRIELTLSQGTNATSLQLTLSDQLYRQVKIDEENRLIHDNDDDIYPTVKVTRDGELPENATESENKDNDNDVRVEKNKKYDLYRALNIDLNEKPIQSIPIPSPLTSQLKESVPKQVETPPILTEKPKQKI
ncbi:unnamed protein product [Rotaria sordida]|uniref:AP-3 complex subunit delta domain-containing protein n=1 Tax=Rotaria sordida TaxID=392033 RepID=A0A819R503_9BILA|nr:unnamed protein product [Rotaria sordida]